jgi:hypothetical protein
MTTQQRGAVLVGIQVHNNHPPAVPRGTIVVGNSLSKVLLPPLAIHGGGLGGDVREQPAEYHLIQYSLDGSEQHAMVVLGHGLVTKKHQLICPLRTRSGHDGFRHGESAF